MHVALALHWQRVCRDHLALGWRRRAEVCCDHYVMGALQFYRGRYHLWCSADDGLFALEVGATLAVPGTLAGFVLLVRGRVEMFFSAVKTPLDWPDWTRRPDDARRAFYVDQGFVAAVHG